MLTRNQRRSIFFALWGAAFAAIPVEAHHRSLLWVAWVLFLGAAILWASDGLG